MKYNQVLLGDCREVLKQFPDNTFDVVVTDPPYGLSKEPDIVEVLTHWLNGDDYYHSGGGFMSASWDSFVPGPSAWKEVYRVLKPGGHLLCFAGTRTEDLMGISLRLARFERRDLMQWLYGSGWPKGIDISKEIDKKLGVERTEGVREWSGGKRTGGVVGTDKTNLGTQTKIIYDTPASNEAKRFDGFHTSLKPANEPIILCKKPISEKTIVDNVLKWGTGALNINGCRIPTTDNLNGGAYAKNGTLRDDGWRMKRGGAGQYEQPSGRWPANVILDESWEPVMRLKDDICPEVRALIEESFSGYGEKGERGIEVLACDIPERWKKYFEPTSLEVRSPYCAAALLDEQSGVTKSGAMKRTVGAHEGESVTGFLRGVSGPHNQYGDSGGASRFFKVVSASEEDIPTRFFYCQKASKKERTMDGGVENNHPTVKPISLMEYLITLVTPPGGVVLDPFCGSGSTLLAAQNLGFQFVGIDSEKEYVETAKKRLEVVARERH